ncbi:MAG TPA: DUF1993 domain-containing protein [Polyangiales bacterium]|jgi:hypothetical protein|nr:DUF1993 domain-containing protein [Polyangiales bacterium]
MLYQIAIVQHSKMLQNLSACLDKAAAYAETKKFSPDVLLQSRLAPDQFALLKQIQVACDHAKAGAARLTGKEIPSHSDDEKSLADAKARIAKVVAYLQTFSASDFAGAEERRITNPRWGSKHMLGADYACEHLIPNFFFHTTTAYAILRHNGVDLGKGDFLGAVTLREG